MKKNVDPPTPLPEIIWTRESASAALAEIMQKYPDLCSNGMGIYCDHKYKPLAEQEEILKTERAELVAYLHNVAWVATWCQKHLTTRKTTNRVRGSYSLKHLAEATHPRGYITNGEFIAGAIMAGLTPKIIEDYPNAYFNISMQSLKDLNYQQPTRRGSPNNVILPLPFEKVE